MIERDKIGIRAAASRFPGATDIEAGIRIGTARTIRPDEPRELIESQLRAEVWEYVYGDLRREIHELRRDLRMAAPNPAVEERIGKILDMLRGPAG